MIEDNQPIQMVPKIVFWGRRAGGFNHPVFGRMVKLKKWGAGSSNSGPVGRKNRWYAGRYGYKPPKIKQKVTTPKQTLKLAADVKKV